MKRALVTGGTGEIGQAICQKLSSDYHLVIQTNQKETQAQEMVSAIKSQGGSAEYFVCDICDELLTQTALQNILKDGPIQIIVNNAGIHNDIPFAGMTSLQWKSVMDVSLNGFFHITQPLLLPMMATRWGRIISLSSIAALMGNRGQVNYSAAKAGLHGASKSLALELASRNITVNVVAPGIIDTKMSQQSFSGELIKQLVPMKRAGKPEEVASLVAYLASDEASYISGQVISVNGAMA